MVRTLTSAVLFIFLSLSLSGQGWRKGEMEIRVNADNQFELIKLQNLGLHPEPVSADGRSVRLYILPEELKVLQKNGIRYEVIIADLNKHFEHFWDNPLVPPGYYTCDQILAIVDSLATNFPSICKKYIWGTSVGGRQLAVLKISDNPEQDEPEPEIMFDGGIHGDEVGGSQNVIMFARDLCLAYNNDPAITDLVNSREIWLYPMVNPDGRVAMSRYNNNGVDCNRDNGYMWDGEGNSWGAFSQVETKALRNGILDNQFVVYTNYHSGTEILSYPWSYRSAAPRDLAHIHQLAGVYASSSGYSNLQYGQGYNIMYAINGSTKDFQYGSLGNIGWSIEISMDKQPPSSQIGYYYNANKPAMLEIIKQCGWGVEGFVTDSLTGDPVRATVWVNNLYPVFTDPVVGDFHKYLIPGNYIIKVAANGYKTKSIQNVTVPAQGSVTVNFQLSRDNSFNATKVMSCRIPGNNFSDEGYTPGSVGKADSIPYPLGKNGWVIMDMGDTIYNGTGNDFKVIQSGTIQKAFTVSAGNSMDGPFNTIGTGTGTTSFDLGSASINKARYIQVKDNGTGSATGVGAGFNLDAIEMTTLPLKADFYTTTTSVCSGTGTNFTDLSWGNPATWSWSFPGGTPSSSTQQNPQNIRYDLPGMYPVTLTVSTGYATSSKTRNGYVSVKQSPAVDLGRDTTVCPWSTVLFDAGNPGASFLWSTGATSQTLLADSTGTGLGTKAYWVRVTNNLGCPASDTVKITFETCSGVQSGSSDSDITIFPNPSGGTFTLENKGMQSALWQIVTSQGKKVMEGVLSDQQSSATIGSPLLTDGVYLLQLQFRNRTIVRKIIVTQNKSRN